MYNAGDVPASFATLCIPWDSFAAATGAPAATTNFAAADVIIFKNGGTTQRTSANGITVTTSFDSNTGLQMILIDLSDNTDAGFYAAGNEYQVAVSDVTIDGQTVRFWVGCFSIERAGGVLALLKGNAVKVDLNTIKTQAVTCGAGVTVLASVGTAATSTAQTGDNYARLGAPAGASVSADVAAVKAQTAAIETDTQDIQGRIPAALVSGRLDASVGAMAANVLTAAAAAADLTTELQSGLATAAALSTLDGKVDTIDNFLDTEMAAILAVTAKVDTALEADGAAGYQFTTLALENGPAGGGGGSGDWTADEKTVIRAVLGIPGSGTTPADPSVGILDTIRDTVATRASQTSVDDVPTNAELTTALGTADDATLSAIAALNNLSQANIRTALGLGSANLDTQLGDLPTNAELATALGTADDATLAAIAALNNLSIANIRTAVGLATANLDTQLAAISAKTGNLPSDPADASDIAASFSSIASTLTTMAAYIDTEVAAIKVKTDKLTFDADNALDANVQKINDVALLGDGSATPWGPS